ncbi:hypothetical protein RN001_014982 [Aquatica leii]|uniref:DDE Tnp4 domain-containing protein n=1 Tax=Aquatica leii TaxID=1421715 RepID=A0AAN7SKW3_9COLE|nr:hypothetical protein RN001_014982 [Aquatica leii]
MDVVELFLEGGDHDLNLILGAVEALAEPLQIVDVQAEERRLVVRNQSYYEDIIPQYDDILFQEHFRMSREIFEVSYFFANICHSSGKKVLFTIWIISKQESFLACGDRFGIARSTAYYVFKQIIGILVEMLPQHIVWPNNHDSAIETFTHRSGGFPGIIGAIDGCHIKIKQPINNAHDYYNRHHYHSIILQGVTDHQLKFIDVFIGLPGRMHDARVFRNSDIYRKLTNQENPLLPEAIHLLGDSAYPLMTNLMTPFRDNGHLTARESRYNTKLSSARSVIEQAFGRLKAKFRRLKDLDVCTAEMGTQVIAAACVLHNLTIELEVDDEEYENDPQIIEEEDGVLNPQQNRQEAELKRNYIMDNL